MEREKLKKLLREELTKTDKNEISSIARKEIKDSEKSLTKRIEDEVRKQLKSGTNEKQIKKIISNTLEEFYKLMWVRKQWWKGQIEK